MHPLVRSLAFLAFICSLAPQAVLADAAPEPCITSSGIPGVLFEGFPHQIQRPNEDLVIAHLSGTLQQQREMEFENESLYVFEDLGDVFAVGTPNSAGKERSILTFEDANGNAPYRCYVDMQVFDPAVHDDAALTWGECDFDGLGENRALKVGHAVHFEKPFEDYSIVARGSGDFSMEYSMDDLWSYAQYFFMELHELIEGHKALEDEGSPAVFIDFEHAASIVAIQPGLFSFAWFNLSPDGERESVGGICTYRIVE